MGAKALNKIFDVHGEYPTDMRILNPYSYASNGGTDPQFSNVKLLLHCDGVNGATSFVDHSGSAHTITANGTAQVDTSFVKYGTGSLLLNGGTDYLSVPASSDFAFGTGDFTLEFWMRNPSDNIGTLFAQPTVGVGNWALILYPNDLYWQDNFNTTNLYGRSALSLFDSNWHHIAICRSGTENRMFFDGVQQGATVTDTVNYNGSSIILNIGYSGGVGLGVSANLDDIRITKGYARYTSNFTPPTAAFPNS